MIETKDLVKRFGTFTALNSLNLQIESGQIYGLVGSNGSGKSTLLRLLSGVYEPDEGALAIDHEKVFDNPNRKAQIFFLGDTPYFFNGATLMDMADFYSRIYPNFSFIYSSTLASAFINASTTSLCSSKI